jgi:hypothetical protein
VTDEVGGIYRVVVARGVWEGVSTWVVVGACKVGVRETGKRPSGVMVGTGDDRATCKVVMRSCALPVPGISVMICFRIFSLITGTTRS